MGPKLGFHKKFCCLEESLVEFRQHFLQNVFIGAPPKHRVQEHQQLKNRFLKHRLSITSTFEMIDCQ